jgi:outer membrane usher protein
MRRRLRVNPWSCLGWLIAHPVLAQAAGGVTSPPERPILLAALSSAPASAAANADDGEMAFLEVRINGLLQDAPRPLLRLGAYLLVTAADLKTWRLVIPGEPTLRRNGTDLYDLRALAGARISIDEITQTVDLQLSHEAFETSVGAARGIERPPVFPSVFGTFMNYDIVMQQDRDGTRLSGLFDATASADWGTLGTNLLAGQSGFGGGGNGAVRLDSSYVRDDPDRLRRLTVGDSITQSAPWSTPIRFGGVQFGTRFGLQPGYITYPLPTLRGGSAIPSSVEVYIDNVMRYQQPIPAGPFAINNVPVLSGAGEMRFTVTDALGVRRSVTTPYYVSANLLRSGLSDYSIEAGWTRLRYGERSFDYGDPFVSGSWRRGLTDRLTVDLRAEAAAHSRTAGAGLTWIWGSIGEFSLHGAASGGQRPDNSAAVPASVPMLDGSGRLVRASYTRSSKDWNFSVMRQVASRNFTQIGWQDDFAHINRQTQVFAGRSLGPRYGSVGASYTQLGYSTGDRIVVTSANWSIGIGATSSLSTYIARTRQNSGQSTTSVGLTFSMVLDANRSASVSMQRSDNQRPSVQAEFVQLPPGDLGLGYRVRASRGDTERAEAGVEWRTRWGIVSADAAAVRGETATRLRASGSVGLADGMLFTSRSSNEAFALVTVEGSPGITIYRENQPWAVTNDSGRAIVPGLRAYGTNYLSIDAGDLPIEATLRRDSMQVVPRYRSIADVRFDLSYDLVVNATVQLADGTPLPPGIDVVGADRKEPLLTGYGGAISIAGPRSGEVFEARWRGQRCRFALGIIDPKAKLPSLGPYTCEMVRHTTPAPP